jgi:probable addiction module antidote protein
MKKKSSTVSFEEVWLEKLRDPKRARLALKLALEEFEKDDDLAALLDFLRILAKAQGGLSALGSRAEVTRQGLHKALSPEGNPRLKTFQKVLASLGLRLSVQPRRAATKRLAAA